MPIDWAGVDKHLDEALTALVRLEAISKRLHEITIEAHEQSVTAWQMAVECRKAQVRYIKKARLTELGAMK